MFDIFCGRYPHQKKITWASLTSQLNPVKYTYNLRIEIQ